MRFRPVSVGLVVCLLHWTACCVQAEPEATGKAARATPAAQTYVIRPGDNVQFELQSRLIEAVPGDVIQLEAGRYSLQRQLDVAADNVTIRGRGPDQTILTFKGQAAGSQGIEATGNNFTLADLAVEDTAGNAVKIVGARNVTVRGVRVEWTGPPTAANGAYGIYPVQCENVLLERCTAIGAADAGLYVGQSRNVVVRKCRAERNVAGIEIENTVNADVVDNVAINNAGGILVFDMPGLQLKAGRNVRVFRNQVTANNHANFADAGAIVAAVPPGTGVMVMATDHVEIFNNEIRGNATGGLMIVSYLAMDRRIADPSFDAIPEYISVHDNRITDGGSRPQGQMAQLLVAALGKRLPDILWDGIVNPTSEKPTLRLADNGNASFANFNLKELTAENIQSQTYQSSRDATGLIANLAPLPAVVLAPHDPPTTTASAAALVYRSLPRTLSEFKLFDGPLARQAPAAGVVLFDLNTPLFSDYAEKRRFLRLPPGTQMQYRDQGVFEFPVGTVIAKTFSFPHDMRDVSQGERIVETRIELLRADGWYGATYVWNSEQTDADLALGGSQEDVKWIDKQGNGQSFTYQIPNANQCLNCHSLDKAFVPIGPTARNLNRLRPGAGAAENQLSYFADSQMLHGMPDVKKIAALPRFDNPRSGPAAARARAWLDVNCAHCHRPEGLARTTGLDLRWEQKDAARLGVWKTPVAAGHGSGGRKYDIVPGKPDESILVYRLESVDPSIAMPSVGRRLVDQEAVAVVREWIAGLPTTQ